MSQQQTIVDFLSKGRKLTTKMATSWGITNPTARICELRSQGHVIYTNHNKNGSYYKMGKPTREMIRLAYAVGGQEVFGGR